MKKIAMFVVAALAIASCSCNSGKKAEQDVQTDSVEVALQDSLGVQTDSTAVDTTVLK